MGPNANANNANQKALRSTPRAKRQNATTLRMGASPYKGDDEEKESWSCRFCFANFHAEGKTARYHHIPGSKKECRCGKHKGECFLAVQSGTKQTFQQRLEWLQSSGELATPDKNIGGASGRGKPRPTTEF